MLRLRLLGGLSVESDGAPVGGSAAQPRRLALLAVIAHAGASGVTREHLQALLWPDLDEDRARKVLTHAIYALRRDLGGEDAIAGVKELRLDPEIVSCDLFEFDRAVSNGTLEPAAEAYGGPFLHGFRLPGVPEFDRWADAERTALAHRFLDVLEKLGRDARRRGDADAAVRWWRRAAAQDPLNARITTELMDALVAAGNVAGALQQARIYEALVEEELSLPPDREVVRLAGRIREAAAVRAEPVSVGARDQPVREEPAGAADQSQSTYAASPAHAPAAGSRSRLVRAVAAAVILAGVGVGAASVWRARSATRVAVDAPVFMVGAIRDHREGNAAEGLGTTADLLATNLARATGLRVVSTARVYELLAQMDANLQQPTPADLSMAARLAGATELIDGAVYPLPDGRFRFDLRRTRIPSGELVGSHTLIGDDLFALADSGTARLVHDAGARLPGGTIAAVTTTSEVAYRFYEEGLRHYYRGDLARARTLFEAALGEDSTFAMATFYLGLALDDLHVVRREAMFERARALAARGSERERLIIEAGWAQHRRDPSLVAVAETLAVRYPLEIEGHLYSGLSLVMSGRPADGIVPLRRVVSLDSLGLERGPARCHACEAMGILLGSYVMIDSLPAALREARRWVEKQEESIRAWREYGSVLLVAGRSEEAAAAFRRAAAIDPRLEDDPGLTAVLWILQDRPAVAEQELRRIGMAGDALRRFETQWYLAIALREQGKLAEALAAAELARGVRRRPPEDTVITEGYLMHAQVLLESGAARQAASIMDSLARREPRFPDRSAWAMVHRATALAAAGDTAPLPSLADTLLGLGAGTLNRQHVHHYVRGLLHEARGDAEGAVRELRQALATGPSRTYLRLGALLTRLGRPGEAVPVLQAALRGGIEGRSLYTTRTELHETLALAWDAARRPDSAAAHWRVVAESWRDADPVLRPRRDAAVRRLGELGIGAPSASGKR
ncbi:MAG TPA: BTAD domain-containing putative transcriptional regulator [Gemmatimonadaceae bacterium]|nr:BTAD domain-containing putative transcriptional regulator [Gemmatimonadaceae bacterium]